MRVYFPLVVAVSTFALAGCDQGKNVTVKDKHARVTISANGQQFAVQTNNRKKSDVTVSGNGADVTVHAPEGNTTVQVNANGVNTSGTMPAFVNIYPGATVVSSVNGGNAKGNAGTVTLETTALPSDVIDFYKQKAAASGFVQKVDANDFGALLYSATSGTKTIQVLASKDSKGTHAQVTWSGQ